MPRLSVAWVMLQRVPPDMRILTPGRRFFSSSCTRGPHSAARIAATSPAAPAPMTATSTTSSPIFAPFSLATDVYHDTRKPGSLIPETSRPRRGTSSGTLFLDDAPVEQAASLFYFTPPTG